MPRKKLSPIADDQEVLAFLTAVLRGSVGGAEEPPSIGERCRAAELLGKHQRLFDARDDRPTDDAAAEAVRSALNALRTADA